MAHSDEPAGAPPAAAAAPHGPDVSRVAVLLNANARRVGDALAARVAEVVGREHLFHTHSLDEAEAATRAMVQRGYGTLVCGGGDGTLFSTYNLVRRYIDEANALRGAQAHRAGETQPRLAMPRFACLALGTGNGLRQVVGAGEPLADLARLCRAPPPGERHVELIAGLGDHVSFLGMGYDADLLHDYNALRSRAWSPWGRAIAQSLAGYAAAAAQSTVPRTLRQPPPTVRVTATAPASYLDPRAGDAPAPRAAGSVLYEGPAYMVGLGTTPFFGYGFRAFPFAGTRAGAMQLRVATMGPLWTLAHLPALWRGSYRHPAGLRDFLVRGVDVEVDRPVPFQRAGDGCGLLQRASLQVAAAGLRLVDMAP